MEENNIRLTIGLVPSTVWYSSIYQFYKKSNSMEKWDEIKKELFEKEGKKCWICGKETNRLDAHEFWKYDDVKHIQKLEAIHHLCGFCHKVKHIGLWLHTQDGERMLKKEGLVKMNIVNHFCNVNKCSEEEFRKYEEEAFRIWSERNKYKWKQDFGEYDPKINVQKQSNVKLSEFF